MHCEQLDADRPLPQSLCHIARLGLRNANAAGFAIDQLVSGGEAWVRKCAEGLPVPESERVDLHIVCFPLGTGDAETGALSFVFHCPTIPDPARRVLNQIAVATRAIWGLWNAPRTYARSVIRIAELEAELADSKIADRACALLECGAADSNPIDALSRTVDTIVRPFQLGAVLDQLARDLEHDLAEYELVRKAKTVLQNREGMSEEQAYMHLRLVSRQSRRRLRDVAGELIETGIMAREHEIRSRPRWARDRLRRIERANQHHER